MWNFPGKGSVVKNTPAYNLFKIFLTAFLFFFVLWDSYNLNVGGFHIVPKLYEAILNSFHSFSFIQRRQWHPTPVLLPGKSHGRRSLVGCSPWGRTESDMTERLHFHFSLSCIGERNGNPLQCSCLENPRDGRAWWAASVGLHRVGHN